MHTCEQGIDSVAMENAKARRRLLSLPGEPLFIADWDRALFIHFEVDPLELRSAVPFELDLFQGRAFVSLVAFTLRNLRPRLGGFVARSIVAPIATHEFLNVRTYVRHRGESGIYFLAEWVPNRFSLVLGPRTFGLPYRLGRMDYQHHHERGAIAGGVTDIPGRQTLGYQVRKLERPFAACEAGTLSDFLLERYTAFTSFKNQRRFFRIWHEPWKQTEAQIDVGSAELMNAVWPWFKRAQLAGANYSPGAGDVWMGWPHRINTADSSSSRFSAFLQFP